MLAHLHDAQVVVRTGRPVGHGERRLVTVGDLAADHRGLAALLHPDGGRRTRGDGALLVPPSGAPGDPDRVSAVAFEAGVPYLWVTARVDHQPVSAGVGDPALREDRPRAARDEYADP